MRGWRIALLLIPGAVALVLAGSAAYAQGASSVSAGPVPAYGFEGVDLSLSFEVLLDPSESPSNISDAALYFDAASQGPTPTDYTLYASRADGSTVDGTNFTTAIVPPSAGGTLYLIFVANVSGTTVYNASEWALPVRAVPVVTLNDSASTDIVFVGRNWTARVEVAWPYADLFDGVWIRADSVSHPVPPSNASAYPNASLSLAGPAGAFDLVLPSGAASGVQYYIAAVSVGGALFLSSNESNVSVVPEPILSRDASSPWVFVGRNATVSWSLVWPASVAYPLTEVRWDTATHFPGVVGDYPNSAGATGGTGSSSFSVVIAAPASPGRIYFMLRAVVLGEEFVARDLSGSISEFSIEVRVEPTFTVASPPAVAFVNRTVPVEFRVVWPYATDLSVVGVYFDSAPHGSPPNSTAPYPGGLALLNVPAGLYNFSLDAPAAPGSLFFILRASVAGVDFLSPIEYPVTVFAAPSVTLVLPAWELPSALAVVRLDIVWNGPLPITLANIYFDTASHGASTDFSLFPQNGTPQAGPEHSFTFTVPLPGAPGSVYFLGRVRIDRYDFAAVPAGPLAVVAPPDILAPTLSPDSGVALYGQVITVTWSVEFAAVADISTDFRWDGQSHAGSAPNFADYPNATPLQTKSSASSFSGTLTAPIESVTLYGTVRVLLHGRNFYLGQEVTIVVLPLPTLDLLSYPQSVKVGERIEIAWRVNFVGNFDLVAHTAFHWGLISKAGQSPSLTNYPGVGGPFRGNSTNTFNATIPGQTSEGHVYFIVHALVNGVHIYLPIEYDVTVTKAAAGPGGGFLPGPDAAGAFAALAAASAIALRAAAGRRRR